MPETRLVIFDLDNTLVINKPAAKAAYEAALRFLAKETKLEFNKLFNHWKKIVQQLQVESTPEKRALEYSLTVLFQKQNIDDHFLAPTLQTYEKELIKNIKPMPGAREIVSWLKEQKAVVAVSAGTERTLAKKKLKATALYPYIDMVISTADVGSMKPHKDYFDPILTEFHAAPHQTMVISDSKEEDLDLAQQMGMGTLQLAATNPHLVSLKDDLAKFLTFAE